MSPTHRATLAHARELIGRLAAAEREFLASQPYRLAHEHDMRAGRYLVRVHAREAVPDSIARQSTDIVRTIRLALDELATSLAGAPVTFPIFESLALFAQRARKAISRMSDEAQATLEELQPYHAIGGFRNGPLWTLRELASSDALRLAPGSVRSADMGVNTQRKVVLASEPRVTTGAFADDAIIGSVQTKIVGPEPKLDMYLRVEYALAFAAVGPGRGREVVSLLEALCDHVEREVFSRF